MAAMRYGCCACCKDDPGFHDEEFAGHEIGCDSCRDYRPYAEGQDA